MVDEGDLAVDLGADVGACSIALAAAVGDDGALVAVEPDAMRFELLERNLRTRGFPSCRDDPRLRHRGPRAARAARAQRGVLRADLVRRDRTRARRPIRRGGAAHGSPADDPSPPGHAREPYRRGRRDHRTHPSRVWLPAVRTGLGEAATLGERSSLPRRAPNAARAYWRSPAIIFASCDSSPLDRYRSPRADAKIDAELIARRACLQQVAEKGKVFADGHNILWCIRIEKDMIWCPRPGARPFSATC